MNGSVFVVHLDTAMRGESAKALRNLSGREKKNYCLNSIFFIFFFTATTSQQKLPVA